MRKLLFLLLVINVHFVYGQLVVEYDGDVKLHYPIPEEYLHGDVIALFGGSIYVSRDIYQDIPTGIDPIRNSTAQNQLSPINTCIQLRKLLSPMDDNTTEEQQQVIDNLQKNDSLIILVKKDGGIAINYSKIIPVLVSAINDLQDEISMLKKQLNSETDKH